VQLIGGERRSTAPNLAGLEWAVVTACIVLTPTPTLVTASTLVASRRPPLMLRSSSATAAAASLAALTGAETGGITGEGVGIVRQAAVLVVHWGAVRACGAIVILNKGIWRNRVGSDVTAGIVPFLRIWNK